MKKQISAPIKDKVSLDQYMRFGYATACEDCSHFDFSGAICTLGYPVEPFLKQSQLKDLKEKGEMAFCRTQEID